jgi:hypothetical protein
MKPRRIILHHSLTRDSETVSWGAIRRYHMQDLGWRDIGYHFGIERVGDSHEILMGRMIGERGAHCKESEMNKLALGICFVGNFDLEPPRHSAWVLGLRLVRSLCEALTIPYTCVHGHNYYNSHKSCPGKLFDVDLFRSQLPQRGLFA